MSEPSVGLRVRARQWLEHHYSGRGWDEGDLVALAGLLAEVQAEERAATPDLLAKAREWISRVFGPAHVEGEAESNVDLLLPLLVEVQADGLAAVVAWLRTRGVIGHDHADAIERGEHLKGVKRG